MHRLLDYEDEVLALIMCVCSLSVFHVLCVLLHAGFTALLETEVLVMVLSLLA